MATIHKQPSIPFNKPVRLPRHAEILGEAIANGALSGNGPCTKRSEQWLERQLKKSARLVTSATHALEMMALLIDIKPEDEVIVPSFTFVSAANAFALRGARLRFADNDEHGNILTREVERLLTKKTKAVMAMNYAGGSADLFRLLEICKSAGVPLLEDAAQSIGAFYRDKPLGTLGSLGCFSFHDTKNVTSGEGGALILGDQAFLDRAEIIREKGTNRSQFMQGLVDKYTWVDIGSSYVLSELNVAYLWPQLECLDEITRRRGEIWKRYDSELRPLAACLDARVFEVPAYNATNYHMFGLVFPANELRNRFMSFMSAEGITCPFHYVPLHKSPIGASFYDGKPEELPGCESLSQGLVRLPLYFNMTSEEQDHVIQKIKMFFNR